MLGSSILSLTTQATLNVVAWLIGLSRAFHACLTYSQLISKDGSYFKKRCTKLWLSRAGDCGVPNRVESALMIEQLKSNITSKNTITFLGTPITQAIVDRMVMYKVMFAVSLFGHWWYTT